MLIKTKLIDLAEDWNCTRKSFKISLSAFDKWVDEKKQWKEKVQEKVIKKYLKY